MKGDDVHMLPGDWNLDRQLEMPPSTPLNYNPVDKKQNGLNLKVSHNVTISKVHYFWRW